MILRLAFSFIFISLVTGNQWLEENPKPTTTVPCQNKVCVCQDQPDSSLPHTSSMLDTAELEPLPSLSSPSLRISESYHGSPTLMINKNPSASASSHAHVETGSYDMEFLSEENPTLQIPHGYEDDSQYAEKTICFTPSMAHKMVKAALEYVSHLPSDVHKVEQESNRMTDSGYIEEQAVKKPLYPFDSKTIFHMLNRPVQKETNLVLKYELPSVKEPQCREALENLMQVAYSTFLELEQHPQCRDYLYRFAHQYPGHIQQGSEFKSLIISILDELERQKPKIPTDIDGDRYGDMDAPIQPYNDYNVPQIPDYNYQKIPESYESVEYNVPQNHEYSVPQIQEYNVPQNHEYSVPQVQEYNVPQIHEYNVPQIHEYNVPQIHEYNVPESHEYIPEIQEIPYQHVPNQDIFVSEEMEVPKIYETVHESVVMKPEETIDSIISIIENTSMDNTDIYDRLINIVGGNQHLFRPKIFEEIISLLDAQKYKDNPNILDILLFLLTSQKKQDWPWSDRTTDNILSYLSPDVSGNLDSRVIDIILNMIKNRPNERYIEFILSLLRPFKEGTVDHTIRDVTLDLITAQQKNILHPEYVDILLTLLKTPHGGIEDKKEVVDIANDLSRWNEMGMSPKQLDTVFSILKPQVTGNGDRRTIDIIHFLLTQSHHLTPKDIDFILSFLYPENGVLDTKRVDIIDFLLNNIVSNPTSVHNLLYLLQDNGPNVLNSKYFDILLFLDNDRLLSPEIFDTIIRLLKNDIAGQVDDHNVKSLFFQLSPHKHTNPKLIADILDILNKGGLHDNILEWLETVNHNVGIPSQYDRPSPNLHIIYKDVDDDHKNEYRTPDGGYEVPNDEHPVGNTHTTDTDLATILKILETNGMLNSDHGTNSQLVSKILNLLEIGSRQLGDLELTYMLKHEKPLIYQPVYYVKYRLPILSFITNMKALLMENPHLNADPMKLLHELILLSNVTEVSPNLQGYPKEEILKLTVNDGDLVQAKILDEQSVSLNEQIKYVHGLNLDISPEEILQLNRMNDAEYLPNIVEVKGIKGDKLTLHEVDKFLEFPPVHYRTIVSGPTVTRHVTRQTYIGRSNENLTPSQNINPQRRSQNNN